VINFINTIEYDIYIKTARRRGVTIRLGTGTSHMLCTVTTLTSSGVPPSFNKFDMCKYKMDSQNMRYVKIFGKDNIDILNALRYQINQELIGRVVFSKH